MQAPGLTDSLSSDQTVHLTLMGQTNLLDVI
jgi:hypothetical protein